ncbi:MAG: CoA pyrophosphatase [Deltaproteobacteria bacterium]|nr:CoA pyrophosphatase [Deltaproteobacteria bacterium]
MSLPDAGQRRAAVAVLLRPWGAEDVAFLFIKRAEDPRDPWSGHMAFPGGRVDPRDADPLATARRETREEVGLDLEASAILLGRLDELQASAKGRRLPLIITPFVFAWEGENDALGGGDPELIFNDEVEAIHWIRGRELRDPAAVGTTPYVFGGKRYDLPCLHVQGRTIWGLTYQMLMHFFDVVGWPRPSRL